jgi:hypothetical protein
VLRNGDGARARDIGRVWVAFLGRRYPGPLAFFPSHGKGEREGGGERREEGERGGNSVCVCMCMCARAHEHVFGSWRLFLTHTHSHTNTHTKGCLRASQNMSFRALGDLRTKLRDSVGRWPALPPETQPLTPTPNPQPLSPMPTALSLDFDTYTLNPKLRIGQVI